MFIITIFISASYLLEDKPTVDNLDLIVGLQEANLSYPSLYQGTASEYYADKEEFKENQEKLSNMETKQNVRMALIISCSVLSCICVIVIITNNKKNKILESHSGNAPPIDYPDNNVPSSDEDSVPLNLADLNRGAEDDE